VSCPSLHVSPDPPYPANPSISTITTPRQHLVLCLCAAAAVWCPGVPPDGPVLLQAEDSVAVPPITFCSSHHALDQEEQEYLELLNLPAGQ